MNPVSVVILAAGRGKRMYSDLPKVLHPIAGKPMLARVIDLALSLLPSQCVVVITTAPNKSAPLLRAMPARWRLRCKASNWAPATPSRWRCRTCQRRAHPGAVRRCAADRGRHPAPPAGHPGR